MKYSTLKVTQSGSIQVHGNFSAADFVRHLRTRHGLADISSRMWLRNFIFKLMWLSPVIALAAIAVHARTFEDPFIPQSTDPTQEARILALRPIVAETENALKHQVTGEQVLQLMDRWNRQLNESKEGRLVPVGADDVCTEGAKGEIFHASASLSTYLMELGQAESEKDPLRSLDYYKAALENSELFKYMDLVSVRSAVLNERRAVRLMAMLKLDSKTKVETANYLEHFLKSQKTLERIDGLSEAAFNRSRDRENLDLVSLRGQKLEVKRTDRRQKRSFGTSATPELVVALRMTHYTQSSFESLVRSTIEQLSG